MQLSPQAAEILSQVATLRQARAERLRRDLEAIDEEYDRCLERLGARSERDALQVPLPVPRTARSRKRAWLRLRRRLARLGAPGRKPPKRPK